MAVSAVVCIFLLFIVMQSAYEGYKNGILGMILPVIAFVLAILFSSTGNKVYGNVIDQSIAKPASDCLSDVFSEINADYKGTKEQSGHAIKQVTESIGEIIKKIFSADSSDIRHSIKDTMIFVIAFLFIYFLLKCVTMPLTKTFIIGSLNRAVGTVLGTLFSIIKIWVFMDILYILGLYIPSFKELNNRFMESNLFSLISSWNLSAKLLGLY